jgi:uncharacterized protein YdaU (DUF1376 family)
MHLSPTEVGIYVRLLIHCWQHGSIPTDPRQLCRITGCEPRLWHFHARTVLQFWCVVDASTMQHNRVSTELRRLDERANRNKAYRAKKDAEKTRESTMEDAEKTPTLTPTPIKKEREERISPPAGAHVKMKDFDAPDWPSDYRQRFWEKYPHKVGKGAAIAKLEREAKRGRVTFEDLMAGLDRYVRKTDDRPWCNPSTWIFQQRWLDQPAAPAERNGASNDQRYGRRAFGAVTDDFIDRLRTIDGKADLRGTAGEAPLRELPPRQSSRS